MKSYLLFVFILVFFTGCNKNYIEHSLQEETESYCVSNVSPTDSDINEVLSDQATITFSKYKFGLDEECVISISGAFSSSSFNATTSAGTLEYNNARSSTVSGDWTNPLDIIFSISESIQTTGIITIKFFDTNNECTLTKIVSIIPSNGSYKLSSGLPNKLK